MLTSMSGVDHAVNGGGWVDADVLGRGMDHEPAEVLYHCHRSPARRRALEGIPSSTPMSSVSNHA